MLCCGLLQVPCKGSLNANDDPAAVMVLTEGGQLVVSRAAPLCPKLTLGITTHRYAGWDEACQVGEWGFVLMEEVVHAASHLPL